MIEMIIIIIAFLIIVLLEMKNIISSKNKLKVAGIFSFFILISLILSLLLSMNKRPLSPADLIEMIFNMLGVK
ncbi:hypothetical protein SAMN05444401_1155 [Clostridium amylolyticum]|uniref:Uncharacterized protein n=2 Tax=Clostridium amylolyticum TaxID=1121298 RepID=A0A1M6CKW1_9CLOT|nr:hypothetical protein SAMN05444401_1155 [Clostridium amylolyticum]